MRWTAAESRGLSVAEVRNAASGMLDILAGTKNKTAAEVSVEIGTDAPKLGGQSAVHDACSKHCWTSPGDRA